MAAYQSYSNHPPDSETEAQIKRLVQTVYKLMPQGRDGWVSWRKVAKEMYGTEEFAVSLSSLAQMECWRHLFASTERVVKLTEAGIRYVHSSNQQRTHLSETQQIAEAVRRYASRLDRIYLKVSRISNVARVGRKVVQAVFVEFGDNVLPSEAPVEIRPSYGSLTHGKIVGQDPSGGVLYVALDWEILQSDLPATLSIDRGYLLFQLSERILTLQKLPPRIEGMLQEGSSKGFSVANDDSLKVISELSQIKDPWSRYLWGPPGAGKTYAMGHLALRSIESEPSERVLILAPSNRAVDVALEQFVFQLEQSDLRYLIQERKILRYGYPRAPRIIQRPELLGPSILDELNLRVKRISGQLARAEKEEVSNADIAILHAELLSAQEEVKQAVSDHIRESRLVATTTTLAYLPSSPISESSWNTVLVDEVTMVTPSMCTFLASLATDRYLLAGDPRQLGPVYERSSKASKLDFEWMGRDVFDKSGISRGTGEGRRILLNDSRMARITSQRRCAPEIWSKVRSLYPEVANLSNNDENLRFGALPPCPGSAVVLLDTSQSVPLATCERVNYSWQNQFTAELALEVALTIAAEAEKNISIAIITPYRSQVRLLREWLRQEKRAEQTPYTEIDIDTGTVHQFQGSDADVVIFDLVDGPGRQRLGSLLTGDTGLRLVNVALTRAKGKFVILADRMWCRRSFSARDNPILWELVMGRAEKEQIPVLPIDSRERYEQRKKVESPIEEMLYEAMLAYPELQNIVAQFEIKDYGGKVVSRADFAFPEIKYAVYCDGRQWHLREDRWQRDLRQRNKLTELGWIFSVFTGGDIFRDADGCASQIAKTYRSRSVKIS
jgi:very-short-patch-repair endonuclease